MANPPLGFLFRAVPFDLIHESLDCLVIGKQTCCNIMYPADACAQQCCHELQCQPLACHTCKAQVCLTVQGPRAELEESLPSAKLSIFSNTTPPGSKASNLASSSQQPLVLHNYRHIGTRCLAEAETLIQQSAEAEIEAMQVYKVDPGLSVAPNVCFQVQANRA